jgi:UDP-glucose 4-epimerase
MASGVILVTGGAGFIGSHVVERLLETGATVRVFDNLSTGYESNLAHVRDQIQFQLGDLRNREQLQEALIGVDSVVHLGAIPSVPLSIEQPIETHSVNYGGTLNLLEAMRIGGVDRIIYASSAAVYSPFRSEPHQESDLPDPTSPYGVDKLAGEFALAAYGRLHGLKTTALRFFNIYGERQDPSSAYSGVISIFAHRIRQDLPITIHGDGSQSRDFVYVRDLARMIVGLIPRHDAPSLMNIGKGSSETLNDLVAQLSDILGKEPKLTYGPPRPGDIPHSRSVNKRIQSVGFDSWTTLEVGLLSLVRSLE